MVAVVLISACGNGKPSDLNWPVQNFGYTDQNGESFGLSNLKDKVWMADFIFTSCVTVCPPMTYNMANIQKMLKEEGLNVEFVSFSVDPETDQPEVLKSYLGKFDADFSNWHALTGYSNDTIQQFGKSSFKTIVKKEPDSDQYIHGTTFFLIDQSGTIVTKYNGLEPDVEKIIKDVKALQ